MLEGDARVDQQAPGAGPREVQPANSRLADGPSSSGFHPRNANRTGRFHRVEGGKYLSNRTEARRFVSPTMRGSAQIHHQEFGVNTIGTPFINVIVASEPTQFSLPTSGDAYTWILEEERKRKRQGWKRAGRKDGGDDLNTDLKMLWWGIFLHHWMTA